MTKRRFNDIRARLLMRFKSHGSFEPKDDVEKFVVRIIKRKWAINQEVLDYVEGKNDQ